MHDGASPNHREAEQEAADEGHEETRFRVRCGGAELGVPMAKDGAVVAVLILQDAYSGTNDVAGDVHGRDPKESGAIIIGVGGLFKP